MLDAKFIVELKALEQLSAEWDALAVASGLPFMAPGWALPWWRHIAPKKALLRVIEIRDGTELVDRGLYLDLPEWGYHVFDMAVETP